MSDYKIGDLVVLLSGSMRMGVEAVDGDHIACVWCNEGEIGRDNFDVRLVKKWEFREDLGSRGRDNERGGDRSGNRPFRGDREGGGKPYGARDRDDRGPRGGGDRDGGGYKGDRDGGGYKGNRDDRGGDRDKPKGKTGWDGKPREKKFFRKDD